MSQLVQLAGISIPLLAIGIAPFKMWLKVKERQLDRQSELTAEKTAQYAAHTERLEERVRVLERIVTDKGSDLTHEIEALRFDEGRQTDAPRLPQPGLGDPQVTPMRDLERTR